MGQIFISYSRRDTEIVDKFAQQLEQAGMDVWIDRQDIKAGDSWRLQIVEAIDTCEAFVLMASENSLASVNVQKEIILAHDASHPIFIVQLEQVTIPSAVRYQLAGLQMVEVPILGVEKAGRNLIAALQEHLRKSKPAEPQKQAELVIQGIDLASFTADKQQQLLAFLANLTNTDQSNLQIANLAAGSVHAFVKMPARVAYQLKTLALNHDPRLAQMNIAWLRLLGSANFINTASGELTSLVNPPRPRINLWLGLIAIVAVAGFGIFFLMRNSTPVPVIPPTDTATATVTSTLLPVNTETPTPTASLTATATSAPEPTLVPTATATLLPSPSPTVVYQVFDGVVTEPQLNCRYGPGPDYLYQFGFISGLQLKILGRDETGTWLYVQGKGYDKPCWLNGKLISMQGDVASLEVVYPGKVKLPPSRWPMLQNVTAKRNENQVEISWNEFLLPLGERESAEAPLYLIELWVCQNGQLTFMPKGVWEPYFVVTDEPGCSAPSHGRVYLAEKHGYAGPVEILWP